MKRQNIFLRQSNIKKIEEFDEPLAQPGKIFLAEIHGSAQRFLKVKKLSKYIRFCKCCLLPSETPGVVIPYTCLDNKEDFGIGIQLYFYYIFFCSIICLVSLVLCSIPAMVFSKRYYDDVEKHCESYFYSKEGNLTYNKSVIGEKLHPELSTNSTNCYKYLGITSSSGSSDDNIIKTDWIMKFSSDNVINYYNLFKEKSKEPDKITEVLFDYCFMHFLTSIILLIINFFFIHYVNLINDKEDFESTTPRDYTLLIHGVTRPNKDITKLQHLKNILTEISKNYFRLEVHKIIPCYNLVELYKLTKNVFEDKIKIYHAYNFKRQKNLHTKYLKQNKTYSKIFNYNYNYDVINNDAEKKNLNNNNDDTNITNINNINNINLNTLTNINNNNKTSLINQNNNLSSNQLNQNNNTEIYIHDQNLGYYKQVLWMVFATPLNKIEQRIAKNNQKIKEIEKDLADNPDKHSSGTYFVVFKYIKMKDKFYEFFPVHTIPRIFLYIKYFFQNIIFSGMVSDKTKRANYIKKEITVEYATEAYEVVWQNMGYSLCSKSLYLLASIVTTIVLICFSFLIIFYLNSVQFNLTEGKNIHKFYEYLLSFLISIIISLINSLGRKLLKLVTKRFEAIETKTDYYISLSIKMSIFTFINTDIVPLLSNYFQSDWNENSILLNNIFMIFLTNFTLKPLVFYLNPNLLVKLSKRARARKEIEGLPLEESTYTQDELNRLFQNPSMSMCYKYSFYTNIILTTFFYMSLFPLGVVFSFVGLLLSYFLEIVHLGFYKRPEVLNSRLCKCFIHHFKVVIGVFAVGNFVFLRDVEKHYDIDWSLINLILFIIIAFIPYHEIKFNLLGVTEGEITKGSYDEYELMFPTDYEKQNPLTKKAAMIKYFKLLRKSNLIDDIQNEYLTNRIKKESAMVNYYKTSKNVGNILNYYEFQNQFVRLKKKYKFIKLMKNKNRKLNTYEVFINQKARERRETLASINPINELRKSNNRKITDNVIDIQTNTNNLEDYSQLGYDKNYKIKGLVEDNPKYRRRISKHMREALFQSVKDQGLYSETEDESDDDDDSLKSDNSDESSKNIYSDVNNSSNNYKHDGEYKITYIENDESKK